GKSEVSIKENTKGATITSVKATDEDGDKIAYAVSDDRFEVVSGNLKLKAGQALDYEKDKTVTVKVTANDGKASVSKDVTITVTNDTADDINHAPVLTLGKSAVSVKENVQGTTITTVSAKDEDGDKISYSVSDSRFEIDDKGNLKLKAGKSLDYETEPSLTLKVTAQDDRGATSDTKTVEITVQDDVSDNALNDGIGIDISDSWVMIGSMDNPANETYRNDKITNDDYIRVTIPKNNQNEIPAWMIKIDHGSWQLSDDYFAQTQPEITDLGGYVEFSFTINANDGKHKVEVSLADANQKPLANPKSIEFTVDTTPAEVQIDSVHLINDHTLMISGSLNEKAYLDFNVELPTSLPYISGYNPNYQETDILVDAGKFTKIIDISNETMGADVSILARDISGNYSVFSEFAIINPLDNSHLSLQATDSIESQGNIYTSSKIIQVDGVLEGQTWVYRVDGGKWQTGTGNQLVLDNPSDGAHSVEVSLSNDGKNPIKDTAKNLDFVFDSLENHSDIEQLLVIRDQIQSHEYQGESDDFVSQHSFVELKDLPYFISCLEPGLEHTANQIGQGIEIKYHLTNPNELTQSQKDDGFDVVDGQNTDSYINFDNNDAKVIAKSLTLFSQYANIQFTEVSTPSDETGQIDYILAKEIDGDTAGYAYFGGDVYIEGNESNITYTYGSSFELIETETAQVWHHIVLHETLHSLGLEHPFQEGDTDQFYLPSASREENTDYSVLSYTYGSTSTYMEYYKDGKHYYESVPYLRTFDVAALHYLYGVAENLNAGNTTYGFHDAVTDQSAYHEDGKPSNHHLADGTYIGNMVYIADGAGLDTFSAQEQTTAVHINLTPGSWSYIKTSENLIDDSERRLVLKDDGTPVQGQMFIGYGTQIENAIGGSGNDEIIGNEAGNFIDGGTGIDIMTGGFGDDVYVVDNAKDQIIEERLGGTDSVYSYADHYQLSNYVENGICMGSGRINMTGNALDNVLLGNDGNNRLAGGGGNDTIEGGSGADVFVFDSISKNSVCTITDFNTKEDKLELHGISNDITQSNWQNYLIYNHDTGDLAYSDAGNASSAITFAHLSAHLDLTWNNIQLI
ncbi:MAG: cadherin domain-containing protein, partial [Neisseriaceae bacterium]|nr:cadherin domain-containing protein [Neisseriaceae bacterium]